MIDKLPMKIFLFVLSICSLLFELLPFIERVKIIDKNIANNIIAMRMYVQWLKIKFIFKYESVKDRKLLVMWTAIQ